jgi:hypothetical protein
MDGWMDGWMDVHLAPEQLDGFYSHSVLTHLCVTGRQPVNMNMKSLKIGTLHMGAKKNAYYIESGSNDWIKFQ